MELKDICLEVNDLCREVGAYISAERKSFDQKLVEVKGLNDFVSYVDKTSEQKLITKLKTLIPNAGFIAEEGTESNRSNHYNWIIDPLDGTTNFIHGFPFFAISIALMHQGELILGVVYEITQDECFYSWKGVPAYLNGKEISVSNTETVKGSLIGTGFPYHDYDRLDQYLKLFRWFMENSHGVRRPGSAATDLAYVACGRFDGFFEYGLSAWDVAAGAFLINQAGGSVSDFNGDGDFIFGREILAGNKNNFQELRTIISKFMN